MGNIWTVGGHADVMLTALLALFVLITVAWALRCYGEHRHGDWLVAAFVLVASKVFVFGAAALRR
jgi:hypothetical protein